MTRFKKVLASFLALVGIGALGGTISFNDGLLLTKASSVSTLITVDTPATTSETFTSATYTHPTNEFFQLTFDHVKAGGGVGTIKGGSYVRRAAASKDLKAITVDFSTTGAENELKVQSWYDADDLYKYTEDLNSGERYELKGNYFCLIAGDKADIIINSIEVEFGCTSEIVRPNTDAGPYGSSKILNTYMDMQEVFTWDDKTNDISWYIIQLELKDNKEWPDHFPNRYKEHRLYDGDRRMQIDEVRLLSSGRMQIYINIFAQTKWASANQKVGDGDFWAHLSYDSYVWDNKSGDVKPNKFNGGSLTQDGGATVHGTGGCSKGSYTCWSSWGMANLTIDRY